jgi:hypothetical protein
MEDGLTKTGSPKEAATLSQAVDWFEEAEDSSRDARARSEKCRDYYDHKQWTKTEEAGLTKRKQPVITRNRIKPKVDFLKGLEAQTRTDPKAYPRTPQHSDDADAATDAIRFVCDDNQFSRVRSDVFENLTVEGTGGAEVYVKERKNGLAICIKRFHWDRIFYDPHSREKDFSDAMHFGGVIWLDHKEAVSRWPESEDIFGEMFGDVGETYDDAPRIKWTDAKRKRVRIVQMWFKSGDWYWCEFTKGGWLTEPQKSPYLDADGETEAALILQSSHVDREGNRYGSVLPWLDPQDEINKRASKHLHLVSVRQTYSTKGAVPDVSKLKNELAKPDGHLEFVSGQYGKDFGVLPTTDMAMAQFNLMQEAKQEIDSVGVNAALSGSESRDLSGKAISRLQQGSSTETKPLFDALGHFNQRIYRAVWNRVRQFWTEEKWIRVTDDERNVKFVGLNKPVTLADKWKEEEGEIPPEMMQDPRMGMVIGIKNNVAEMDVDISIEEVPDTANVMQEQFEALTAIFPAIPDPQKPAALEMLIESSNIRNKSQFLEKLKGGGEDPQQQAMAQQEQMEQQQMAKAAAAADIQKKQADAAKAGAEVQKVEAETQKTEIEVMRMAAGVDLAAAGQRAQ